MTIMLKVSDCRAEFKQRKKDISDVDNIPGTFIKWCNYINRYAYNLMTNVVPEGYIKTQLYNFVPALAIYDLPEDFQDIIPKGTGFYQVGNNGIETPNRLLPTGYAAVGLGFYLTPVTNQVVITPIPVSTSTYNLRYIPQLTDLSAESSELVIPKRWSKYAMDALDTCYNIWDEEPSAEIFNDDRFISSMAEFISLIDPSSQAESLPDFSLDF